MAARYTIAPHPSAGSYAVRGPDRVWLFPTYSAACTFKAVLEALERDLARVLHGARLAEPRP